jgi:ribose 5-phosphate isomerase A
MDFKKQAAQRAVELIKDNAVIGLGAGSAMSHLADLIKEKVDTGLSIKILTSSFNTGLLMREAGLTIQETSAISAIDIYFDGCDQFDKNLHALKSGGGIHTNEKILAVMANEFILVGDDSKYVSELETKFPLVVEVLPQIFRFFYRAVEKLFPGIRVELRTSNKKDGAVISENGNYLFDLWFNEWPELAIVNPSLKNIPGVVETSLFYNIAKRAIIAGAAGIRILEK